MSDDDRSDDDAPEDDPFGDEGFDDEPFESDPSDDGPADPFDADADDVEDPFAALGEGVEGPAGEPASDEPGFDETASTPADPEPSAPDDDPFAEIDVDAEGAATEADPFESMGAGDVGEEDVWEALDEGTSVGADAADLGEAGAGSNAVEGAEARSAGTPWDAEATGDERVIDKRSYCQQCPHFSEPPETACTHEGTDIVESVDFSRFRVRNCPMVDAEDPAFDAE